ncbi:MAG: D-alanine--D-alanine ligase family protein [Alphaproteobacteria bacterium]
MTAATATALDFVQPGQAGVQTGAFSLGNRAVNPARRLGRLDQLEDQVERLFEKASIAIVYGGDKTDPGAVIRQAVNARSWKSYRSVAEDIATSLKGQGAKHIRLLPDDMRLGERLRQEQIDFVWLNTGGVQGRNPMSHAAAMLEMLGVPYLGHDPLMTGILDSKYIFKQNVSYLGMPTADFAVWNPASTGTPDPTADRRFLRAFGDFDGPFIVKPVSGRASLHVHVVDRAADLADVIDEVYSETENDVLIETYLGGREYCIAIGGPIVARKNELERMAQPFAFSPAERRLDPGERIFTSMDQKPITGDRVALLDPKVDQAVIDELKAIAQTVYADMQLESLVRLDIRADLDGKLHILESNPKPDLAAPKGDKISIVSTGLGAENMTYDDLIRSMFADRIDLLFCKRRGAVTALDDLLG